MLRTFRDRLRLRRTRRDTTNPTVITPATPPDSTHESNQTTYPTSAIDKPQISAQPRVFRNRSADSATAAVNGRRDRQLLALLSGKALRTFHRARTGHDKLRPNIRDRPVSAPPLAPNNTISPTSHQRENQNHQQQNHHNRSATADDSFLSLPSTHASRDPFLNDDVPLDLGHDEDIGDHPRQRWRTELEEVDGFHQQIPVVPHHSVPAPGIRHPSLFDSSTLRPSRDSLLGNSPPVSFSSAGTFRKRCSLWRRTYDPEDESQVHHEREILRAVSLLEASVKEDNVNAAQDLANVIDAQTAEFDTVLNDVKSKIEDSKQVASQLPSLRDPRFEHLLYDVPTSSGLGFDGGSSSKADAERIFMELNWTERIWDVESLLAEKRYEECFTSISKLQQDGIMASGGQRTKSKFEALRTQLGTEMCIQCAEGGKEVVTIYAPLLIELEMDAEARNTILSYAENDLYSELQYLFDNREVSVRMAGALLDLTLAVLNRTYVVHSYLSRDNANCASPFVAWIAAQADRVYEEYIAPILTKVGKADPVTILATIEAIRYRRYSSHDPFMGTEKSLAALLQTRIVTHLRKDVEAPLRDAEHQLSARARTYASAIPRNWRDGPYQSGKAVCDELNVLTRGLEGSLVGLGSDVDILSSNLLVMPALVYCTTLLERGMTATEEDRSLSVSDMQEGAFVTFHLIGKTMERLHQRLPSVPLLERVGTVLTSSNPGEVRVLYGDLRTRRSHSSPQMWSNEKDLETYSFTLFAPSNEKGYWHGSRPSDVHHGSKQELSSRTPGSLLPTAKEIDQQARRLLSHHRRTAIHG